MFDVQTAAEAADVQSGSVVQKSDPEQPLLLAEHLTRSTEARNVLIHHYSARHPPIKLPPQQRRGYSKKKQI